MIDDQLRRAIEDSGLSARGLAARAGVPASAVVRFVAGDRDVQLGTAARLCEALGLRLGEAVRAARRPAKPSAAKGSAGKGSAGAKG